MTEHLKNWSWVNAIEQEETEPIQRIREEANIGICQLCGKKCTNYLNGKMTEYSKHHSNYQPVKIQQCAVRNKILEESGLDDLGRSCST